jgi:hypothetical protein
MEINKMNQQGLIELAEKLEGNTDRTFEESEKYWREQGDADKANMFQAMSDRWWEIEESPVSEAAATLGRKGGQSKSDAKIAASRENGKKGGRPQSHSCKTCSHWVDATAECGRQLYYIANEWDVPGYIDVALELDAPVRNECEEYE